MIRTAAVAAVKDVQLQPPAVDAVITSTELEGLVNRAAAMIGDETIQRVTKELQRFIERATKLQGTLVVREREQAGLLVTRSL